jgi:hypothetical protein
MGAPPNDPVASAPLADYLRRIWRASLTPESLLSEDELLEALPGRPARAWLREHVATFAELAGEPVYRWGDVLTALNPGGGAPATRAVSSWRAVARVLGISEDTLARHRKQHGDTLAEPWFEDPEAVASWWVRMHEPPPLRRTARR